MRQRRKAVGSSAMVELAQTSTLLHQSQLFRYCLGCSSRYVSVYQAHFDLYSQCNLAILLFAGEQDLICNWVGIRNLIDDLEFNGAKGFEQAVEQEWYVDGDMAGSWQTARNLTLVKVANASHMVCPPARHQVLVADIGTGTIRPSSRHARHASPLHLDRHDQRCRSSCKSTKSDRIRD